MEIHTAFYDQGEVLDYENVLEWNVTDQVEKETNTGINKIRTGDILLFSASGILSSVIKAFTFSKWNHIGIACWCHLKMDDGSEKTELFCYEMGSQPYQDLITKKVIDKGVRLVRLGNIAEMYDLISVRKIVRGKDWKLERLPEFMDKWKDTPFPKVFVLLKAYAIRPGYAKGQVTCAQLTALMLHHMKVIKLNFDPSQLTPGHFADGSKAFSDSIFIGKEYIIHKDDKWLKKRQYFIFAIVIILIIIVLILHNKKWRNMR